MVSEMANMLMLAKSLFKWRLILVALHPIRIRIYMYKPGTDPGFQVRGGALKKIAANGGRRENFGGISCENHDFTPKIIFFPILEGGARRMRPPPPWIRPCKLFQDHIWCGIGRGCWCFRTISRYSNTVSVQMSQNVLWTYVSNLSLPNPLIYHFFSH